MFQNYHIKTQLAVSELHFLSAQWDNIVAYFQLPSSVSLRLWGFFMQSYSATNRHYHNLSHIYNLLKLADNLVFKNTIEHYQLFVLAVFYHDIIYMPTSKQNELDSFVQVKADFGAYLTIFQLSKLETYILSTAQHIAKDDDADTQLLLDIDLLVLGSPLVIYQQYSQAVQNEYTPFYDISLYGYGRLAFLQKYRLKTKFFYHDLFIDYNKIALENIDWEISYWQN
jgi:predicted metal-dependent HD superfamily phosphohydrolase